MENTNFDQNVLGNILKKLLMCNNFMISSLCSPCSMYDMCDIPYLTQLFLDQESGTMSLPVQ